jgi:hypothetical protein
MSVSATEQKTHTAAPTHKRELIIHETSARAIKVALPNGSKLPSFAAL